MKLMKTLLLPVLFVAMWSLTGCNEEPITSVTPDTTPGLSKLTLPAGAVITNATFNIYVEDATGDNFDVHQVNVAWAELIETWKIFYDKTAPQYVSTVLGSFESIHGWHSVEITSLVQGWYDGSIPNYGVLINQPLTGGFSTLRSREYNGGGVSDPYLKVYYTDGGVADSVKESAFGDTYIWSLNPTTNYGTGQYVRVGNVAGNPDYIKQALVQFDIDQPTVEMECGTAYAFGDTPFCGLPNIGNWGWTELIDGNYTNTEIPIYAGAAQCDTTKGTLVGTLSITYVGTSLTVNYTMNSGVTVDNVHMWIGSTPLPVRRGKLTSAPGQFNYNNATFPFNLTISSPFYVAVHFDVCWEVDPE